MRKLIVFALAVVIAAFPLAVWGIDNNTSSIDGVFAKSDRPLPPLRPAISYSSADMTGAYLTCRMAGL